MATTHEQGYESAARDEAWYLLLDAEWRILAADDGSTFGGDGADSLVGLNARTAIGPEALAALQAGGDAVFTLDNLDFVLSATTFDVSGSTVRVIRAQEVQATVHSA